MNPICNKNIFIVLTIVLLLFFSAYSIAQPTNDVQGNGDTVTLVTSGTGTNKEEATNNALRSALEQAYGTFVSSNTKLVNDEITRDEIVSISSGNIQKYDEISCIETQDGKFSVSLKAVVSIGKLVSFAQSHGASTELAGNTFLRNRDLAILNKKNEKKAIDHMVEQIILIASKGLFDFSLVVSEPYGTGEKVRVDLRVNATPNENMKAFWDVVDNTLSSLNMEESVRKNYRKIGFDTSDVALALDKQLDDDCDIDDMIEFVLNSIQMRRPYKTICLRNNYHGLRNFLQLLIVVSRLNFEIFDNLGTSIRPDVKKWDRKDDFYMEQKKHDACYEQYAGGLVDAYFIDFMNNKKDPYLKADFRYNEKIQRVMKEMKFNLYYSANLLSQLKEISIRPVY